MMLPIIAVIGSGNMGTSLIGGLINNGHPNSHIFASDQSTEKLKALHDLFEVNTSLDNREIVEKADVVIIAVKPQLFETVLVPLKPYLVVKRPLLLSIAAGIRIETIENLVGEKMAIVRAMPNTPALIGSGASALYANQYVSLHQKDMAESIMRAVGIVTWLKNENLLDIVTALSGSGPAYFFYIMEALEEVGERLGLTKEQAHLLTVQTALGSAKMALESDLDAIDLRKQVTSPGGTTERGLSVLFEHKIKEAFIRAVEAAKLRAEELGQMYTGKK